MWEGILVKAKKSEDPPGLRPSSPPAPRGPRRAWGVPRSRVCETRAPRAAGASVRAGIRGTEVGFVREQEGDWQLVRGIL